MLYNTNLKYARLWKVCDEDKAVLKSSWDVIVADMKAIGIVTFLKMFETHPETLSSFMLDVYSIKQLELDEW